MIMDSEVVDELVQEGSIQPSSVYIFSVFFMTHYPQRRQVLSYIFTYLYTSNQRYSSKQPDLLTRYMKRAQANNILEKNLLLVPIIEL